VQAQGENVVNAVAVGDRALVVHAQVEPIEAQAGGRPRRHVKCPMRLIEECGESERKRRRRD